MLDTAYIFLYLMRVKTLKLRMITIVKTIGFCVTPLETNHCNVYQSDPRSRGFQFFNIRVAVGLNRRPVSYDSLWLRSLAAQTVF